MKQEHSEETDHYYIRLYEKEERNLKEMIAALPSINMIETGKRINQLRMSAGLSVREIQTLFGFATPQAIYKWEKGTSLPTIDNLVALAAILSVSLDEIVVTDQVTPIEITA